MKLEDIQNNSVISLEEYSSFSEDLRHTHIMQETEMTNAPQLNFYKWPLPMPDLMNEQIFFIRAERLVDENEISSPVIHAFFVRKKRN